VKFLNYVVYEYILIKRVTKEVKKILTAVNVNRVFTQFLTLILLHFIEVARTLLLNIYQYYFIVIVISEVNAVSIFMTSIIKSF